MVPAIAKRPISIDVNQSFFSNFVGDKLEVILIKSKYNISIREIAVADF